MYDVKIARISCGTFPALADIFPLALDYTLQSGTCLYLTATVKVARLAVLYPNIGNLAVFQIGWPYDFWVDPLAWSFGLFWLFLKICLYFKTELSTTTPFLKVSSPAYACHLV